MLALYNEYLTPYMLQFEAIQRSYVYLHVITLPVLKDAHIADILAKVLVNADAIPRSVRNAVKWLGGVPRFLEYFLKTVADKSNRQTVSAMWKWLCEANLNKLMDVVSMTRPHVWSRQLKQCCWKQQFNVPLTVLIVKKMVIQTKL
jgi:predicted ATPase